MTVPFELTLLHTDRPKLHTILAFLCAIGLQISERNDTESSHLMVALKVYLSPWCHDLSLHVSLSEVQLLFFLDLCSPYLLNKEILFNFYLAQEVLRVYPLLLAFVVGEDSRCSVLSK